MRPLMLKSEDPKRYLRGGEIKRGPDGSERGGRGRGHGSTVVTVADFESASATAGTNAPGDPLTVVSAEALP